MSTLTKIVGFVVSAFLMTSMLVLTASIAGLFVAVAIKAAMLIL